MKPLTMSLLLTINNNDLTDHDLAVLADWAGESRHRVANSDWKRAYSLIREGCDLLLRRRARSTAVIETGANNHETIVPTTAGNLSADICHTSVCSGVVGEVIEKPATATSGKRGG